MIAAGALGTNKLLRNCKHRGTLPRVSDRLGHLVRTNSESIHAVTAPDDAHDFAKSIAITSSIYPDPDTHIEPVTYGGAGDAMSGLYTVLTGAGSAPQRALQWLTAVLRHPLKSIRLLDPRHWSRRTVILLVMQTLDNSIRLVPKRNVLGDGVHLQTEEDPANPNPRHIPAAEAASRWFEKRLGGTAQAGLTESLLNIPSTAHILGGAVIGARPQDGVVDEGQRVHGYENLLVCDGSAMPANPGVNPSLTITAMTERAISLIPPPGRRRAAGAAGAGASGLLAAAGSLDLAAGVGPGAAVARVAAASAVHVVVTGATAELIVAGKAEQHVGPGVAGEQVVSGAAVDRLDPEQAIGTPAVRPSRDQVGLDRGRRSLEGDEVEPTRPAVIAIPTGPAEHVVATATAAVEAIGAGPAVELIVAGRALDPITPALTADQVPAPAAVDPVGPAAGRDHIVAPGAADPLAAATADDRRFATEAERLGRGPRLLLDGQRRGPALGGVRAAAHADGGRRRQRGREQTAGRRWRSTARGHLLS